MVHSMRNILSAMVLLACTQAAFAQFATLPVAKEIHSGVLPGGVSYMIVNNDARKGYADFELIQILDPSPEKAREDLSNLEHVDASAFLKRNRIAPGRDGYITYRHNARCYRFERVPLGNKAVLDSALLMVSDLMRTSRAPQKILISGDVEQASVLRTLEILALTVPVVDKNWHAEQDGTLMISPRMGSEAAIYRIEEPETDLDLVQTAVPLVSSLMYRETVNILNARIDKALREAKIPYYLNTDAHFTRIYTAEKDRQRAGAIIGEVIGAVREGSFTEDELSWAKAVSLPGLLETTVDQSSFTDADYLDRCEAAFFDGLSLASRTTVRNFFYRRSISAEQEVILLNRFARGLSISDNNYTKVDDYPMGTARAASLAAMLPEESKQTVKVKTEVEEPVTGGKLWTLSNGVKVIYAKRPTSGYFHYSLIFRGGLPLADDIRPGQSAYFPEIFSFYGAPKTTSARWRSALEREGISMSASVGLSQMSIDGEAQSYNLENTISALTALSGQRTLDSLSYHYFAACEKIAGDSGRRRQVRERVDSILSPAYKYLGRKDPSVLTPELLRVANYYYHKRLLNWSGATLVLLGDLEEEYVKKTVCKTLSQVPAGKQKTVRRNVPYNIRPGVLYLQDKGDNASMQITLLTQSQTNVQSHLCTHIVAEALRDYLSDILCTYGLSMEITPELSVAPKEMLRLTMDIGKLPSSSLPADVCEIDAQEAFTMVAAALDNLSSMEITDKDLARYKAVVSSVMTREMQDPQTLCRYISMRYSDSKDLCVNWSGILAGVSVKDVRKVISAFAAGSRVEYRVIADEL